MDNLSIMVDTDNGKGSVEAESFGRGIGGKGEAKKRLSKLTAMEKLI